MIIQHDADGRIYHVVNDPVHPLVAQQYHGQPNTIFLSPMPGEVEPLYDEKGNPLLDQFGEPLTQVVGAFVPVCDIMSDYVENGKLKKRPTFIHPPEIELAVGESVVIDVPAGATAMVDDQSYTIDDGVLEIVGEMPAEYEVTVTKWPYMEAKIQVVIHEA